MYTFCDTKRQFEKDEKKKKSERERDALTPIWFWK